MSRAWREEIAVVVHAKGWPVPVILPLRPETCDTCEESLRIADAVLAKVAELLDSEETREAVALGIAGTQKPCRKAIEANGSCVSTTGAPSCYCADEADAALGVLRRRCGGGA